MRHLIALLGIILCTTLLLCGCENAGARARQKRLQEWMVPNGKLKVLNSTAMIDDLVKKVGGEYIDTHVLIQGDLDPHSYQLVKGDDEKLAFADVIFSNGLDLEHGPSLRKYLSDSMKAVPLGDLIFAMEPEQILYIEGQVDPHIWLDISLWAKTLPYIVETLSQRVPDGAETFQRNAKILSEALLVAHEKVRLSLQAIPEKKRYLVTSHDAFNYFTRVYLAAENEKEQIQWQKRFAAPEGLAPDSQLSTTDIQEMIDHVKKYQIKVLFPECNVSFDSMNKILQAGREKGVHLVLAEPCLYADAMGPPGSTGDTYLKMIKHNAKMLTYYLSQ